MPVFLTIMSKNTNNNIITGILEKTRSGAGFVRQEEDGDIYIDKSNMRDAMHGDTVRVDLLPEYLWGDRKSVV